jgi:hypothetical protein
VSDPAILPEIFVFTGARALLDIASVICLRVRDLADAFLSYVREPALTSVSFQVGYYFLCTVRYVQCTYESSSRQLLEQHVLACKTAVWGILFKCSDTLFAWHPREVWLHR